MKIFLTKKGFLITTITLLILVISLPLLAPFVHHDDSARGAIRNHIYNEGYPYQSFISIITNDYYSDAQYGERFNVKWITWKSETGTSPSSCYAQKTNQDHYEVSCGAG
ncbi:hypothetical protein WAK64_18740 [Bacillus spongiae]|uniref:DUF3139 domain-containing protein n=1 Tax=Bacillus spongiae TaxID=2683610 RepID=A0ABU8HIH6_9BACI